SGQIHVRNSDPTTTETAMEFACFPAGTRMLTASGPKAIERLRAGDLLITASGKARPLAFLGVQTIHPHPVHGHAARNLPVRIAAHAFGPGAPARPLITSWWHGIMLQGGWIRRWFGQERIIVPAGRLINGGSIRPLSAAGVITLYNVVLEAHDVVFAEGLSVETFRPLNGNQRDFDNWREFAPFHLPDAELEARYPPCCPVLDSDAEGRFIGQNLHRLAGEQLTAALLWPLQAA
ncbi:Hint domain-containing protein, partial [Thermopetrobacter sp. TC1]|uniref:Hint domain-containing protein n=1 Tax=Thermopetrobacter sp. TC1 TaxID=1495045 RepID=UPI00068FB7A4